MKSDEILSALDTLIPDPKCALDYEKDYELLIAVMLSAQSTDKRVNIVTKELFKYNLEELANMDEEDIIKIIKSVGTYHKKAKFIKQIASSLIENYDGKVPHDRKYLESLPGVGHKTTNVVFIEKKLQRKFPKDKWGRLHLQLVLFGRHFCTAKKPSCEDCPFNNKACKKPRI